MRFSVGLSLSLLHDYRYLCLYVSLPLSLYIFVGLYLCLSVFLSLTLLSISSKKDKGDTEVSPELSTFRDICCIVAKVVVVALFLGIAAIDARSRHHHYRTDPASLFSPSLHSDTKARAIHRNP